MISVYEQDFLADMDWSALQEPIRLVQLPLCFSTTFCIPPI